MLCIFFWRQRIYYTNCAAILTSNNNILFKLLPQRRKVSLVAFALITIKHYLLINSALYEEISCNRKCFLFEIIPKNKSNLREKLGGKINIKIRLNVTIIINSKVHKHTEIYNLYVYINIYVYIYLNIVNLW